MKTSRRRAIKALGLLGICGWSASARAVPQTASRYDYDRKGWSDLLKDAGAPMNGWRRIPIPADQGKESTDFSESQWTYDPETKTLACSGKGPHEWISPNTVYRDFIFHVEFRFLEVKSSKKVSYNSGVYFRNSKEGAIRHQVQIGDASGGYIFGETRTGEGNKRFNLAKRLLARRIKPAGDWNVVEIECKGRHARVWINGGPTAHWEECDVESGYVGLEAEGYAIEFRTVMIKPLETEAGKSSGAPK